MRDEKDSEKIFDNQRDAFHQAVAPASFSSLIPHPSSLSGRRPTWAEINLDNLIHNFRVMREAVGPDVAIMPAVKADAYGHGARECALALEREGARWFGVALPEEGSSLREAGIQISILCLGNFWEGQEDLLVALNLTPAIFGIDPLERFDLAARRAGCIADYHLNIDTGMGRLGVPFRELRDFLDRAAGFKNLRLDGVMTHFSAADEPSKIEFTSHQMTLFEEAVEMVRSCGHTPAWIHQANSAATHAYPLSRGNMVRLGGVTYGLWRDATNPTIEPLDWRRVLSLHSRIVLLKTVPTGTPLGYGCTFVTERESRIATIPIGYADGLSRALSNAGRVIVRDQFAPIVGRVSMDLTIIDVTDVQDAATGDEVIIIGGRGRNRITVEDIAAQIGTISYEVTCAISDRVPRIYTS